MPEETSFSVSDQPSSQMLSVGEVGVGRDAL